ncbi:MAG: cbb3-type cytochrome oxidase assembly protein [Nitrospirae bacterium]|nr:cbb3-type cytochrome oxidase assembly protein [Nitrospirota bacterium]
MNKRDKIIFYVVVFFILIPGAISFLIKIGSYFMVEVEEGMSGFALPFFNYLFVALGFVALFVWAYLEGHFRDIERPAIEMLEREQRYEEEFLKGGV